MRRRPLPGYLLAVFSGMLGVTLFWDLAHACVLLHAPAARPELRPGSQQGDHAGNDEEPPAAVEKIPGWQR
jgi:hypothetical protein